jgi:hypothetical protein
MVDRVGFSVCTLAKLSISPQYIWIAFYNSQIKVIVLQAIQWFCRYPIFGELLELLLYKQAKVDGCKPRFQARLMFLLSISPQ